MNKRHTIFVLICLVLLASCAGDEPTPTPTIPPPPTAVPTNTRPPATPTAPRQPTIFVPAELTGTIRTALLDAAKPLALNEAENKASADVVISSERAPNAQVLSEEYFVVVDWFPATFTNIGSEELLDLWQGVPTAEDIDTLLMSPETLGSLTELWGAPGENIVSVPADQLVEAIWNNKTALAIMPFDQLVPRVKALHIDDVNILDRDADMGSYPLVTRLYASGDETFVKGFASSFAKNNVLSNRLPERMTELIMTGVTAISRTSAFKIDAAGDPTLPAREVGEVLAAADITHVSNEVPFTERCTPVLGTLQLCSKPNYIEALKVAGVDLISSTGNHMNDYGLDAFRETLDLFDREGFKVFGGGRNIDEAKKVLIVEDHGNKLAFLGMNSFGPQSVWATADRPGAQQYDQEALKLELAEARANADVVFFDMQGDETYQYEPNGNNRTIFRDAIANGADVVTGVQAHQPQAVEFSPDGKQVILYGLGNLFFDQMQSDNVRQGLVVRHTIHNGKLIQTELLPTLLEDYVYPRWATPEEAQTILDLVFGASGFK